MTSLRRKIDMYFFTFCSSLFCYVNAFILILRFSIMLHNDMYAIITSNFFLNTSTSWISVLYTPSAIRSKVELRNVRKELFHIILHNLRVSFFSRRLTKWRELRDREKLRAFRRAHVVRQNYSKRAKVNLSAGMRKDPVFGLCLYYFWVAV